MRIIPVEHRDIITSSTDADIEDADVRTFNWSVLLPLFLSLMFGFSSCKDTDLPVSPERDLVPISFSVEMDNEVGTRLCIDDGYDAKMNWEVGDRIKLYDGCTTPHVLEYKSTGKFEGDVCPNRSYSDYRAVYPVSTTSSYNDVSIGATQAAVIGSFDKASVPMIAFAPEANKLSFKRAFSLLKITVPTGYSKIVVSNYSSSGNASYLTGAATLTYNRETTEVGITKNSGTSSVTLVPEQTGGTYYLSVFPCDLTGLQLSCFRGDEIFFKCKAGNSVISRSQVVNIGDLTSDWNFTCQAVNIGCVLKENGKEVNYYIADRNLGITESDPLGIEYPQGSEDPANIWGPGWSLPNDNTLEYWAGGGKNYNGNYVNSSFNETAAEYSLAKDNETGTVWVSLPVPNYDGNFIGNYWGTGGHYLYISKKTTESFSATIETNFYEKAYIRPVFTVPAQ